MAYKNKKYPAGEIEKNGITVPIFVTDSGHWEAEVDGRFVRSATRDGLAGTIARATKRAVVRVAIPFTVMRHDDNGPRVVMGTATGVHQRNSNILVTWANGIKEQVSFGHTETVMGALTQEERDEWVRLKRAAQDADSKLRKFVKDRQIDLRDVVEKAQDEA